MAAVSGNTENVSKILTSVSEIFLRLNIILSRGSNAVNLAVHTISLWLIDIITEFFP